MKDEKEARLVRVRKYFNESIQVWEKLRIGIRSDERI